jgi:hypothetical protein
MRAQTYRPRVQNGPISKRKTSASRAATRKTTARRAPQRGRRKSREREGSNLFLSLVIVGALVATGFVFSLRSQISARQIGEAETRLRTELDDIANQQRYEILERQRATRPSESDRAAQQAGLIQPRFDQPKTGAGQVALSREPVPRVSKPLKESNQKESNRKESNQRQSDRLAQRR